MQIEGVNVFGPVEVASGLGTAVRGHVRAMWSAGLRTRIFPFKFSARQGTQRFEYPDEQEFFDLSIVYANPDATEFVESIHGRDIRRSKRKIAVWVWELPAARAEHIPYTRHYDEIWVPSTFNHRAFAAVTKTPVHVVPYVVEPAERSSLDFRAQLSIAPDAFVFLYMFDASSYIERKNPQALIRAFMRVFASSPTAVLVLKISHLDESAQFAEEIAQFQRECPNLKVLRSTLDESDLLALVHASDCYASPHRSEGFGFTLAEAMVLGKPVVATDYGSTRDFIHADCGFPVPYRLVEVGRVLGPYAPGAVWAEPSEHELAEAMRFVMQHPAEAKQRAQAGRVLVRQLFSRTAIGRLIAARIGNPGGSAHS